MQWLWHCLREAQAPAPLLHTAPPALAMVSAACLCGCHASKPLTLIVFTILTSRVDTVYQYHKHELVYDRLHIKARYSVIVGEIAALRKKLGTSSYGSVIYNEEAGESSEFGNLPTSDTLKKMASTYTKKSKQNKKMAYKRLTNLELKQDKLTKMLLAGLPDVLPTSSPTKSPTTYALPTTTPSAAPSVAPTPAPTRSPTQLWKRFILHIAPPTEAPTKSASHQSSSTAIERMESILERNIDKPFPPPCRCVSVTSHSANKYVVI